MEYQFAELVWHLRDFYTQVWTLSGDKNVQISLMNEETDKLLQNYNFTTMNNVCYNPGIAAVLHFRNIVYIISEDFHYSVLSNNYMYTYFGEFRWNFR